MHNPFDVTGKVVIVTGTAGFLGAGYARALLRAGAKVVGWDLGSKDAALINSSVNVTDEASVAKGVQEVLNLFGRIDGLVNNAAMNPAIGSNESKQQFAPYEDYDIELFRRELDVNLVGQMICMKHVARIMMGQKSGSIVNVASGVAVGAHNHHVYNAGETKFKSPAYTASKTAVIGLTRQWAARLGAHNVRVNAISIGAVHKEDMPEDFVARYSKKTMLGRMAKEGEYCGTLQYLLSEASSYMTGSNLVIDGGTHAW